MFWDNNSEDKSKEIVMNFGDNRIKYFSSKIHLTQKCKKSRIRQVQGRFDYFSRRRRLVFTHKLELQFKDFFNNN